MVVILVLHLNVEPILFLAIGTIRLKVNFNDLYICVQFGFLNINLFTYCLVYSKIEAVVLTLFFRDFN